MPGPPTWTIASGSLVAGFAVAAATGVRPLGGLVLLAGAAWCAVRWSHAVGPARTGALLALYGAAFAAAHPLAGLVGAWPAVLLVATVVGVAARSVADAPPSPRQST